MTEQEVKLMKSVKKELDKDIIFITALRDIGRDKWGKYNRTFDQYLEYFLNLARHIEYNLVVYLSNEHKLIAEKYMSKNNVIFLDLDQIKDTFYQRYLETDREIIKSEVYQNKIPDRRKNNPEHLYAEYNMVVHDKVNYIRNTKLLFPNYSFYSWIDFGYVRKPVCLIENINLSRIPKKIVYQALTRPPTNKIDEDQMLKSYDIYIVGGAFIIHTDLVDKYAEIYERKIIEWQSRNITDDDQSLVLQLYYENQSLFHLIENKQWFSLFTEL